MLAKVMEVYELCEAPENMAFYVHGQGHAIEHDSRQLIVRSSRLSAAAFPWLLGHLLGSTGLKRLVVWGAVWLDGQAPQAGECPLRDHRAARAGGKPRTPQLKGHARIGLCLGASGLSG